MVEPILVLDGLRKAYGALTVTDNLSMVVQPGTIHALIGPNGAGKTTLIGQISGQIAPDAGRIRFAGNDVTDLPMHVRCRRGLARSFQITTILPRFSALENVAVAAQAHDGHSFRFLRPAASEARLNDAAMAALDTVGLGDRASARAGSLSHGEKRQLEIAIALVMRPKLLLLDEPMAGTGHEESARLVETLEALRGKLTILLVEHDMDAVFALADRISVMVYGRLIAEGPPDSIRADPEVRSAYLGEESAP